VTKIQEKKENQNGGVNYNLEIFFKKAFFLKHVLNELENTMKNFKK
jgi:hypothetical protein